MTSSFGPDQATGLYPLSLFIELLEREVARARRYARPLSVILGRSRPEIASEWICEGWMSMARDVDFGTRLDDFRWAMVLPETGRAGATVAAERFRQGLETLAARLGQGEVCPVSLGVVTHPYHGSTAAALLDSADQLSQRADSRAAVAEFPVEG